MATQGREALLKGEVTKKISISFPGRLEGQWLPGKDRANKTMGVSS